MYSVIRRTTFSPFCREPYNGLRVLAKCVFFGGWFFARLSLYLEVLWLHFFNLFKDVWDEFHQPVV